MKKNAIIRSISAMPFGGKSLIRGMYMAGSKAVRQNDYPRATFYANSIDSFGESHKTDTYLGLGFVVMNSVALAFAENSEFPAALGIASALFAGGYALANAGVVYTQKSLAQDIQKNIPETDNESYAPTKQQCKEWSDAANRIAAPTVLEATVTAAGAYGNLGAIFYPMAIASEAIARFYA